MVIPTLKTCYFEASEDIMTIFKSQALHTIRMKLKSQWEWQPSLPHSCPPENCHFRSKNEIFMYFFAHDCKWVSGNLTFEQMYIDNFPSAGAFRQKLRFCNFAYRKQKFLYQIVIILTMYFHNEHMDFSARQEICTYLTTYITTCIRIKYVRHYLKLLVLSLQVDAITINVNTLCAFVMYEQQNCCSFYSFLLTGLFLTSQLFVPIGILIIPML